MDTAKFCEILRLNGYDTTAIDPDTEPGYSKHGDYWIVSWLSGDCSTFRVDEGKLILRSTTCKEPEPGCFICGIPSSEYASLPNGDVVKVCSDHVCEHGKIHITLFEKDKISGLLSYLDRMGEHTPYLKSLSDNLQSLAWEWEYPCYTCYTTY